MKQYGTPLQKTIIHILLLIGVLASVFPFYWSIAMSTNTTSAIYHTPPQVLFGDQLWVNISHVFENIDFVQSFLNTLFVAVVSTGLTLFFCSIAGFTFAKFDFPGKQQLFVFLIATLILPTGGSLVASYVIMANLGWVNTFLPLIVPTMATAIGIFFMRQFSISSIHSELIDAAKLDGAGHLRLYWHVALPALRPGLAWLGIVTFVASWNNYLTPLLYLNNPKLFTLQVSLNSLNRIYDTDYSMVMAGTLLAILPLIVVFFLFARQFINNLSAGALKF
jgi:cellobiose transport system permease protein